MMHVTALAGLVVLAWIVYRYSQGHGALQQFVPALRELREAWKVAPHRKAAVVTMVVTVLVIAIGLSFVPWVRVLAGLDALVVGLLRQR